MRIIREEQIIEEDNYTVEEDNEDLNTEMGFNGNEIDFDLNINQNQGESPNSQDFDFLIWFKIFHNFVFLFVFSKQKLLVLKSLN